MTPMFLQSSTQIGELLRLVKASLLVEEAKQKTLTPVAPKVAALEGRAYFKLPLPGKENPFLLPFLLRQEDELSLAVEEEQIPFLRHLAHQDRLKKKFRQPLEHDFLVGFPSLYFRDRQGRQTLTTLFKFQLQDLTYPSLEEVAPSRGQQSLAGTSFLHFNQEKEEGEERTVPYWMDELFLNEELGIADEDLLQFRKALVEQGGGASHFLRLFCTKLLGKPSLEVEEAHLFDHLVLCLKEHLQEQEAKGYQAKKLQLYPYLLVYELESQQPTRQLQNDLDEILDESLHLEVEGSHPFLRFLTGVEEEGSLYPHPLVQFTSLPLTASQELAIKVGLKRRLSVINGPPGTGKTHVIRNLFAHRLVEHVLGLETTDQQVSSLEGLTLVSSTNNRAVDNALEGMEEPQLLPVTLRVGSRIVQTAVTLMQLKACRQALEDRSAYEALKSFHSLRKELQEAWDLYKKAGQQDPQEAREIYLKARRVQDAWTAANKERLLKLLEELIEDLEDKKGLRALKWPKKLFLLLTAFPLVGCTLLSLRNFFALEENSLGLVIIDEAGQCATSYLLPALLRAKRALLIGDVHQLEPVVGLSREEIKSIAKGRQVHLEEQQVRFFSSSAEELRSAHHVAQEMAGQAVELKEHFRCRPGIIQICQELCGYDLQVEASPPPEAGYPEELLYLDVKGQEEAYGGSWTNRAEIQALMDLLPDLEAMGYRLGDLAVLTPYKGQLMNLNHELRIRGIPHFSGEGFVQPGEVLTTGTVHRFQGGERRMVLFSHVISRGEPLFLNSRVNLLNVALSRAQENFVFLGNLDALPKGLYTGLLHRHLLEKGRALQLLSPPAWSPPLPGPWS